MGYWFIFLIVAVPLIIFSARPESSRIWRMGRPLLAFVVAYGGTALWLIVEYLYFQSVHGRTAGGWIIWGCMLTIAYISWWELAWRYHYRRDSITLRKGVGDDIINNLVVILGIIGTGILLCIFVIPLALMVLQAAGYIHV